jgi:hypothetical protein
MLKWLNFYFYQYLFAKVDNPKWSSNNIFIDWLIRLKCRINGHSCGCIYYNPGGEDPDGRCIQCGDEIG